MTNPFFVEPLIGSLERNLFYVPPIFSPPGTWNEKCVQL
jgi:hypothetical protein